MTRLMFAYGTRPELIKLAPVILEPRRRAGAVVRVVSTGQHREMLEQAAAPFGIRSDADLRLMTRDQQLVPLVASAMQGMADEIRQERPDWVIVQGDTCTAFATALAAYYSNARVAHVEAGLRTYDLASPYPEEGNRQLISRVTALHFAPTAGARDALLREGISADRILVTGNTVVDAIVHVRDRWRSVQQPYDEPPAKLIFVTCHRREHFGAGLRSICAALACIAERHADHALWFPVHPNPNVRGPVHELLGGVRNIRLMEPVDYETSLRLLAHAALVLTDSGGIQEEAPSFSVPVVVMRDHTERSEGVASGFALLAGCDTGAIVAAAERILSDQGLRGRLESLPNPYGDGHAARRIVDALMEASS
jgi:UDP-N-acetylglucosamine 2-epimerase (non-hydrolysing)